MSLYEFITVDNSGRRVKFVVKHEFLDVCAEPTKFTVAELMTKYKLGVYLHNPIGPAVHRLDTGVVEYWIDMKIPSPEVREKIAHDYMFKNKLDDTINE